MKTFNSFFFLLINVAHGFSQNQALDYAVYKTDQPTDAVVSQPNFDPNVVSFKFKCEVLIQAHSLVLAIKQSVVDNLLWLYCLALSERLFHRKIFFTVSINHTQLLHKRKT